jgi:hypothetical protein
VVGNLNIDEIRPFVATAELGSFTRAGERLRHPPLAAGSVFWSTRLAHQCPNASVAMLTEAGHALL